MSRSYHSMDYRANETFLVNQIDRQRNRRTEMEIRPEPPQSGWSFWDIARFTLVQNLEVFAMFRNAVKTRKARV